MHANTAFQVSSGYSKTWASYPQRLCSARDTLFQCRSAEGVEGLKGTWRPLPVPPPPLQMLRSHVLAATAKHSPSETRAPQGTAWIRGWDDWKQGQQGPPPAGGAGDPQPKS